MKRNHVILAAATTIVAVLAVFTVGKLIYPNIDDAKGKWSEIYTKPSAGIWDQFPGEIHSLEDVKALLSESGASILQESVAAIFISDYYSKHSRYWVVYKNNNIYFISEPFSVGKYRRRFFTSIRDTRVKITDDLSPPFDDFQNINWQEVNARDLVPYRLLSKAKLEKSQSEGVWPRNAKPGP